MASKQCCKNPPIPSPDSEEEGELLQIGGFNCYVSGPRHSNISLILISDVFGYDAPKLRKLADKVAAAGFYTVVPDFFYGDPYVFVSFEDVEESFPIWLKKHGTDQGFEDAKTIIEALKNEGKAKVGAAGFCWGGKVVVDLANHACIQTASLIHPSFVSLEDIKGVKVPISVLGAETDQFAPKELVEQFELALKAKPEVDSFVKIYAGVSHGWAVRYDDEDQVAVKGAEEAHNDMLDWFVKHLKSLV